MAFLIAIALAGTVLNLVVPHLIAQGLDAFRQGTLQAGTLLLKISFVTTGIFLCTTFQCILQVYASERIAYNLREKLADKLSKMEFLDVQNITVAKLTSAFTSDVDAIKTFVSLAVPSIVTSLFIVVGVTAVLLLINWKLALGALIVIPLIGTAFFIIIRKVRNEYDDARTAVDWLNAVTYENISGAVLVRLLNSQHWEIEKFSRANTKAKNIGLRIAGLFANLLPIIFFSANLATVIILALGGYFVMTDQNTLGQFIAFNTYLIILIFPIIVIGLMSNVIALAAASYRRLLAILSLPEREAAGSYPMPPKGDITLKNITVRYGEKEALKNVSFTVKAGTKTAIVGPPAAGKTQILYLLAGLIEQNLGCIEYGGRNVLEFDRASMRNQIGIVFQDNFIFNLTLRENIGLHSTVKDSDIKSAIAAAELQDYVSGSFEKLEKILSERGANLSGGQKQRIALARALALNPVVLLLDDFTARLDIATERKIIENISSSYPDVTVIAVSQKIAPITNYDQVILLMEGEVLAKGTHSELMKNSPEYVHIYNSQRSTDQYELCTQ